MNNQNTGKIEFRYHPNPEKTGAFIHGEFMCDCCNQKTEWGYFGPFYGEEEDLIFCPHCILNGEAASVFQGYFVAPEYCDWVKEKNMTDVLCFQTPGYMGLQQERWISHCGEYCMYLGQPEEEISPAILKDIRETWESTGQRYSLESVLDSLGMRFEGYLFRCIHCNKHILYVQRD